jgi:hypothetical protein
MLSAADFPTCFPWMDEKQGDRGRRRSAVTSTQIGVARWEDDGGAVRALHTPGARRMGLRDKQVKGER